MMNLFLYQFVMMQRRFMSTERLFLVNQLLIATPMITDSFFNRSVIYICEHNEHGAIGVIVNHPLQINIHQVLLRMDIKYCTQRLRQTSVLCGGPIHPERGFVLHPPEGVWDLSLSISDALAITTSKDILQAIATDTGPKTFIFALGYANWIDLQLEQEIADNFWLTCPADIDLLFQVPWHERWQFALNSLGIDSKKLVCYGGLA
jgi:putative transcriptional regulator